MTPRPARPRGAKAPSARARGRSLDPQGKRALFETPVSAARDTIRAGPAKEGKAALYSTGPHQRGSVVVACSGCESRTRISVTDVLMRLSMATVWMPLRRHSHWMKCPACDHRTWCDVLWTA